jgi:hypothetical protein
MWGGQPCSSLFAHFACFVVNNSLCPPRLSNSEREQDIPDSDIDFDIDFDFDFDFDFDCNLRALRVLRG